MAKTIIQPSLDAHNKRLKNLFARHKRERLPLNGIILIMILHANYSNFNFAVDEFYCYFNDVRIQLRRNKIAYWHIDRYKLARINVTLIDTFKRKLSNNS
jgi:hypothetical protein